MIDSGVTGDDPGVRPLGLEDEEITFFSLLAHAIMVYHSFGKIRNKAPAFSRRAIAGTVLDTMSTHRQSRHTGFLRKL
jgi:hypothetical protein